MGTSAIWIAGALVALTGTAAADYESEYDPIDGLGKCTSVDHAALEKLRTVLAASTALVTVSFETDDIRPRRRDLSTFELETFNGGTLHTVMFDGTWIDLAQTFVKLDPKKLDPRIGYEYRGYSTAPFQNLALMVHCPVNGPVLRGIQEEKPPVPAPPAPVRVVTRTVTDVVVERDGRPITLLLGAVLGAGVLLAIRRL